MSTIFVLLSLLSVFPISVGQKCTSAGCILLMYNICALKAFLQCTCSVFFFFCMPAPAPPNQSEGLYGPRVFPVLSVVVCDTSVVLLLDACSKYHVEYQKAHNRSVGFRLLVVFGGSQFLHIAWKLCISVIIIFYYTECVIVGSEGGCVARRIKLFLMIVPYPVAVLCSVTWMSECF